MLREERERRGLSVQRAAEELNLDRWIVEALEADHFLALGAPVYARGHLRKYAALLGLSPDLVVSRYESLSGTPAVPVVTTTTTAHTTRRRKRRYAWPLLLLIVVIAGAIVVWWLLKPSRSPVGVDGSAPRSALGSQEVGVVAAPLSVPAPAGVAAGAIAADGSVR
jgi:cytoskeleton protein RodZ